MATPTLDAYRSLNPTDTRPDEEVVPDLIRQYSDAGQGNQIPDLVAYNAKITRPDPSLVKDFVQSAIGGTDQAKAAFYSLAAQAGDATGLGGLKDWGLQR